MVELAVSQGVEPIPYGLGDDADEAQDHAKLLLTERSLSSYYDEVALKGLQLAANDAELETQSMN